MTVAQAPAPQQGPARADLRWLLSLSWPALRVILTLLLALLLGALIMELSGKDSIAAYRQLYRAALGGKRQLADTLLKATPLIFTGLATMVAFRAGIFNVGVEGSLYLGAFGAPGSVSLSPACRRYRSLPSLSPSPPSSAASGGRCRAI